MSEFIISVEHICKSVSDSTGTLDILRDIDFSLAPRETAAIVGASGSGKSTLLSIIAGLDTPTRGTVILAGQDLFAIDEDARAGAHLPHLVAIAAGEQRARLGTLESQVADLLARYPEGMDAAKTHAQVEFTQAEARFAVTKAGLPPEFERLPERNKRAVAALRELAAPQARVRCEHLAQLLQGRFAEAAA